METEKRLYRSRHALIGGVCSGMADYFNVDPLVVRILAITFAVLSAGLLVVAYGALWIVLPQKPEQIQPFDVEPQSVHSETYGHLQHEGDSRAGDAARAAVQATTPQQPPPCLPYGGVGHQPPKPPAVASWAWSETRTEVPPWTPYAQPPSSSQPTATTPLAPPAQPLQATQRGYAPASYQPPIRHSGGVKAAIWVGSFVIFFGFAALLENYFTGVSWWQFWPLVFGVVGIVQMVVPGDPGHRMGWFVGGLMLFFLGGTLLLMSLNVVRWVSAEVMIEHLWPLLVMMVGFFIIGATSRSAWWTLAAGLCFASFCVIGLLWYALPGTAESFILMLPDGSGYHLTALQL